ncbi:hypothetical protein SAMD00019534_024440 [Acytostelium subglobosum LB1]|uniref:hypothetical protein n=1 Tax=Acytostelium subglobosum LB1 TaxID=1410327 RepID=UPI0006449F30|nr:hypothetical protein SAMD00019534_024440 [Acytostelium subglobosum LB1]GAM19269.1 hypothetical protein SAMD00019534_024440 [Acytostelium subglobosum LB1]|eukprot:XP_012757196.1 hypothetical protein SAMD00019534_024440 [Acytostelium subglobosum LB1]
MSRQLKLELQPGKSLGDFVLGMTISEALNVIKHNNVAVINKVDIIFNDSDPLSIDIVLKLVDDGVLLRFAPSSQRLRVIEIFDVSKLALSYRGSIFSNSESIASFVNIYSKFGPSYPGDFNAKKNVYHLHYPGLSFSFPIPPKFNSLYSEGTELPVELPDGSTPVVSKVFVYSGLQMKTPLTVMPSPNEDIIVVPNAGVYFCRRNCILTFKSTPQDVLSELGPPSKIYHKDEDNMKIHTYKVELSPAPDYFYNYFHLGIDILFDAKRNTAKKYIFHTNFPTHYEFNLDNSKAIFDALKNVVEGKVAPPSAKQVENGHPPIDPNNIPQLPELGGDSSSSSSSNVNGNINGNGNVNGNGNQQQALSNNLQHPNGPLSSSPSNPSLMLPPILVAMSSELQQQQQQHRNESSVIDPSIHFIHPDMKWDEVQNVFGKSGKPVVNNRGSISNPFGSTYFYGYPGIIFEIMRNQYIASVCLFDDSPIYVNNDTNGNHMGGPSYGSSINGSNISNSNGGNGGGGSSSSYIDSIESGF